MLVVRISNFRHISSFVAFSLLILRQPHYPLSFGIGFMMANYNK
jgi:hypothetical protein